MGLSATPRSRVDGHDVIVPVDEHRLGLGADDLLGENHGVAIRRHNLGMSAPALTKAAASHSAQRCMSGLCSDWALIEGMRRSSKSSSMNLVAVTVDILFYLFHCCRVLWLLYSAYTLYLGR